MSITIKELEMLAEEYCFDINEARAFLGKTIKKRGRPSKDDSECYVTPRKTPVSKDTPKKDTPKKDSPKKDSPKPESQYKKHTPNGYQKFMKANSLSITEAAKQWKELTKSQQEKWSASKL